MFLFLFRLATQGMQGLSLSPWQGLRIGIKSQAWGCISLSDALLLVDVKYDTVAHLLYREMLQEHHSKFRSLWPEVTVTPDKVTLTRQCWLELSQHVRVSSSSSWFLFHVFFWWFLSWECLGEAAAVATTSRNGGAGGSCRGSSGVCWCAQFGCAAGSF